MDQGQLRSEQVARYEAAIQGSDRLPAELAPVLLGLAGEVGSILSVAKKLVREGEAYPTFSMDLEEEFGDTIWYLAALCARIGAPLESVLENKSVLPDSLTKDESLFLLLDSLALLPKREIEPQNLRQFSGALLRSASAFSLDLESILTRNVEKVSGAFLPWNIDCLPDFDSGYPVEEQLPHEFEIMIVQRASGKAHMSMNGVFVGDPLLDNVATQDGYRFHDVFHLANAAVLHWSPVTRALLKLKRKSRPEVDNTQDSGRAIVVEEGLAAWLFQKASALKFFDGAKSVPYDILKTIQEFVAPYEVASCPLSLWERSILQSYTAFNLLKEKKAGILAGNRLSRTLAFKELNK